MLIYTVKEGDTISSIAVRYNTTVSGISSNNGLDPSASLIPGQSIVILYPETVYTVTEGDTVLSIAEKFSTSAFKIWQNNPILNGKNLIFPGQTIVISYGEPEFSEKSISGYAYTYIDDDLLRRTLPYLTYLHIFPYGITGSGEITSPDRDERLINTAKEYNTVPLMTLTSLTTEGVFSSELVNTILSDTTLSQRVIDNAAEIVFNKGLGGVDVDFEFIDPSLSQNYADFVKRLKSALGEDYIVFTDLAPKTFREQPGLLYEAHDYSALGESADKLFLMTYEWGYMYGPPLAISPINNVNAVIDYAITEIPPNKLYMGLPSYGYNWTLPYVRGESRATTLSPNEALNLARKFGVDILYDESSQAPYFTYSDNGTEHIVWFQDARSADALARLSETYSLDGIGVWNIMRWFPSLWTVLISLFSIRKVI